jgi:hypothetical protein
MCQEPKKECIKANPLTAELNRSATLPVEIFY